MAILDVIKKHKGADDDKKDNKKKRVAASESEKETKTAKVSEATKSAKKKKDGVVKERGHILTETALKHPHITEKAAILAERGVYTFLVHKDANKIQVAKAVKAIYDVEPVRVNIIKLPAKRVVSRGRRGVKAAKKKALVYLKKGDKIEFV